MMIPRILAAAAAAVLLAVPAAVSAACVDVSSVAFCSQFKGFYVVNSLQQLEGQLLTLSSGLLSGFSAASNATRGELATCAKNNANANSAAVNAALKQASSLATQLNYQVVSDLVCYAIVVASYPTCGDLNTNVWSAAQCNRLATAVTTTISTAINAGQILAEACTNINSTASLNATTTALTTTVTSALPSTICNYTSDTAVNGKQVVTVSAALPLASAPTLMTLLLACAVALFSFL